MPNRSVKKIMRAIDKLERTYISGFLASYGYWWRDKPDIRHQLISYKGQDNRLILTFNHELSLLIIDPAKLEMQDDAMIIWQASGLEWHWKGYGEHFSPDNCYHRKYRWMDNQMYFNSDNDTCDYYYAPRPYQPAFEMAWCVPDGPPGQSSAYHRKKGKIRPMNEGYSHYIHRNVGEPYYAVKRD